MPRITHLTVKSTCIHWILIPGAQILLHFGLRPAVFEIQGCRKSECTEWPQTDPKGLTVKSTQYTLNTYPPRPKFSSVSLYIRFSRYNTAENRKCTEWLQNYIEHLIVKRTLYTLHTYPMGPIFSSFSLYNHPFRDTRLSKIENAPNDLGVILNT